MHRRQEGRVEEYDKETAIMSLKYQTVEEIVDWHKLDSKVQSATSKGELLWLVDMGMEYFPLGRLTDRNTAATA
jgi:hypothetical protein